MQHIVMADKNGSGWIENFGTPLRHPHGWPYCRSRISRADILDSLHSRCSGADGRGLSGGVIRAGFIPTAMFFDVDATLIREESINELAEDHGCGAAVAAITRQAMEGHLDFAEAFAARIRLLKGMSLDRAMKTAERLSLQSGLPDLISWAAQKRIFLFMVSGGFTLFVDKLARDLSFTGWAANVLEVKNQRLTGLPGKGTPLVDARFKASWLRDRCREYGLKPDQVLATGDGANDTFMLREAGLSAGFNPKPALTGELDIINRTGSFGFQQDLLTLAASFS